MIGWLLRQRMWGFIRTNPNHPRAAGYQPNQPGDEPEEQEDNDKEDKDDDNS